MKNLTEFLSDFMNAYTLIDVALILFFAVLSVVYFKRLKSALKKLKDYQFYNTVSAQTIEDYDNQIKLQECEIEERKKYFEEAVAEITELRLKDKNNFSYIQELINDKDKLKVQITYWKERALHQKHTKKVVDTNNVDVWECKKDYFQLFEKGKTYQEDKTSKIIHESKIWLFVNENHLHPYLVNKCDFKPVQP